MNTLKRDLQKSLPSSGFFYSTTLIPNVQKYSWINFMECRNTLFSEISEINSELITRNDLALIETLLFGDN